MLGILKMRCTACGHEWIPRGDRPPKKCPRCQDFHHMEVIGQQKNPEAKELLSTATTDELRYLRGVLMILRANDPIFAPVIHRAVETHEHEQKRAQRERQQEKKSTTK